MSTKIVSILLLLSSLYLPSCTSVPAENKDSAELHMQIGLAHLEKNNLPLALKEFLAAEELDSTNSLIQNNLGLVYFLREKYELSAKHFEQALNLSPQYTDAKNNLARVYIQLFQYKKALSLLNEVSSDLTYTQMPSAYMNYGLLYFNQKQYDLARKHFEKVLISQREDCFATVYLGRCWLELKDPLKAAAVIDKSLNFCKSASIDDAHYYSAIAYFRLGTRDKSISRFEDVIRLFPNGSHHENAKKMLAMIRQENL